MIFKTCPKCNTAKPHSEFSPSFQCTDKLAYSCKSCINTSARSRDAANPAKTRATRATYQRSPNGRAVQLTTSARIRAAERGLEFNLTAAWVAERVRGGKCEATGIPFVMERSEGLGGKSFSPSLDRIDNKLGYTMDNTQVVVWMYNSAKGTGTTADVLIMARALVAANA